MRRWPGKCSRNLPGRIILAVMARFKAALQGVVGSGLLLVVNVQADGGVYRKASGLSGLVVLSVICEN